MAGPGTAAALPERPYLRPWYRIAEQEDHVVLEYGHVAVVLQGASVPTLLPALLPLLDGTRTVDELAAVLGPPARPAIEHALRILAERALLTEGPPLDAATPVDERETAELLAAFGPAHMTPARAAAAVREATATVVGTACAAEEASRLLLRAGVRGVNRLRWSEPERAADADLVLACPSPEELPRLGKWNESMLGTRSPWLQALPFDGRMVAVGPLFVPGETCCHRCYQLRRAALSDYRTEFAALAEAPARLPAPSSLAAITAGAAALLALRWIAWRDLLVPGRLFALELTPVVELSVHHVYRVPRCPACSGVDGVAPPLPWFKEEARGGA